MYRGKYLKYKLKYLDLKDHMNGNVIAQNGGFIEMTQLAELQSIFTGDLSDDIWSTVSSIVGKSGTPKPSFNDIVQKVLMGNH
uniref:Uncharacterized protein n=1 Tax=Megaviridae environmental sample TaxID=1737588 RepID=A0A5J6VJ07_9VIRU|nr:MAG: hypothetical protein [Megaviridae environmental sample]